MLMRAFPATNKNCHVVSFFVVIKDGLCYYKPIEATKLLNKNKVGLMQALSNNSPLGKRTAAFLKKVNAKAGLRDVSLVHVPDDKDPTTMDFTFKLNSGKFRTDEMSIKPSDELYKDMEAAAMEFFESPLWTNNNNTLFWVVPE